MNLRTRLIAFFLPVLSIYTVLISLLWHLHWYSDTWIVIICILATIILIALTISFTASRIVKPLQTLNNAALNIAAGNYGETITIAGPKEVKELVNTFNTMSVCLEEQVLRLKEHVELFEKQFGEWQCSLLLQDYILERVVDRYQSNHLEIRVIHSPNEKEITGYHLEIEKGDKRVALHLSRAERPGVTGLVDLIHSSRTEEKLSVAIDLAKSQATYQSSSLPAPLIWATAREQWSQNVVAVGDYVVIFNREFADLFPDGEHLKKWFSRVFYNFGDDDMDTIFSMLDQQVQHLRTKYESNSPDIIILLLNLQ
ncbi:MAG: HAMP domain-containing protein [Chlamydiales bacterium]|nr:HAMP domain-containing protein [Chlamydiia bacterium]MCP5508217.1 HAMP domain-containing protein [Chlamydiales bacterium]